MVTVLFDRTEPVNLMVCRAMIGSWIWRGGYVKFLDVTFVGVGCVEGVVFFEDIDEGMLPLLNVVHEVSRSEI